MRTPVTGGGWTKATTWDGWRQVIRVSLTLGMVVGRRVRSGLSTNADADNIGGAGSPGAGIAGRQVRKTPADAPVWTARWNLWSGPDPPPQEERETEEREHGVGGVSEFEDLPQWARDALERHGITAAPERVAEAVARAEGEPGRVMSSQELRGLAQMREMEERVEAGLEPPGVWAASGYIKYGEDLEAASRQAERAERPLDGTAEDCDQDEYCFPVRQPGTGWWCKACDKPLRIVRPRFQSD